MSHWSVRITACLTICHSALGQLSANYWLSFFFTSCVSQLYPVTVDCYPRITRGYSLPTALPASFTAGKGFE